MKFKILEKINLRNETKQYFSDIVNYTQYQLYFGITNNFFSLLISVDEINDEVDMDGYCWDKILVDNNKLINNQLINNKLINNKLINNQLTNNQLINNQLINNQQSLSNDYISELINGIEKSSNKSLEFHGTNLYLKFPVSLDLIEWLKADIIIFEETKENYQMVSLPYINSIVEKNTRWIKELIFNKSEESKVLVRTNSYVICKDLHWKGKNASQFYILGFPIKPIKTIRELISDDIYLLEEMKQNSIQIAESYGIPKENINMYFHYHPSYYQLHLHVCINKHPCYNTTNLRHYSLDLIIEKLKIDSNHWKNTTLKFELLTGTKLYNLLKERGIKIIL